jgi:formylglycine-generating enzyme required for sulfatase activity
LEGGGDALSDAGRPPANLQDESATGSGNGLAASPGPHEEPADGIRTRSAREPITQPWQVSYVRLLGTLEIEVVDPATPTGTGAGTPSSARVLPLSAVRGFGPLAKAAFVALVLNLGKGRTPAQLGEAMEGAPRPPLALQNHIGAVRRTGLIVNYNSGTYRVNNLARSQVDVLRFEDLYREARELRAGRDAANDELLIARTTEALQLWHGDPAPAHAYFRDPVALKQFDDWHADMQYWSAAALLRRGGPDDLQAAERLVTEIKARYPTHRGFRELEDVIHAVTPSSSVHPVSVAQAGAPGNEPPRNPWLAEYRECLRELTSSVDLRGYSFEVLSSSSLDAVYTTLYAKPRTPERPPSGQRTDAARPTLETVVSTTRANLVVGDSGSGKSTFLQHLCERYLEEHSGFIPLFLDLSAAPEITAEQLDPHDRLPWQILPELFSARFGDLGVDIAIHDLDALARTAPVVWLIDGLNEVAQPEIRFALAEAISVCVRRWPRAKFVVTSTETGLTGYGTPPGFQRVDVDEFRPEDVDYFLDAFTRHHYDQMSEAEQRNRWEPLARAVRDSADLRDMARSPLLMTAMTLAYQRQGRLPDSRADLLRGAVEWLIHKKAPLLRPYVRSGRDLRIIFSELAYQMIAREEVPLSRVGRGWAVECLRPIDCFQKGVVEFLDAAVSAGGLLMQRGPGDLGMHGAFRDYLAASRIAAKTDDEMAGWWSELAPHLDDPEWHSIIALVPGALLLLGGSERVDLFFNRLGASCLGESMSVRAGRIALGGDIQHELGLSGYRLSNGPRWQEAVRSIGDLLSDPSDVPLAARFGAAVAYGVMGDERLADQEAGWIEMPGGQFWMGSQADAPAEPKYDPDAASWESPVTLVEVGPFAIRRFPVTVWEYRSFVDAGGYQSSGPRYWTPDGLLWRARVAVSAPFDWEAQLSAPNAPVSGVSWHECVAYCNWLTEQEAPGGLCRLPYEREWEYAASRDVGSSQFRWGDRMHTGDGAEANWAGAFLRQKSPVGIFPLSTTSDGVADLFGNVEEWCLDAWEDGAVRNSGDAAAGPPDGEGESHRVVRGGSCIRFSRLCRPTYRSRILAGQRYLSVGFRPVRVAPPTGERPS